MSFGAPSYVKAPAACTITPASLPPTHHGNNFNNQTGEALLDRQWIYDHLKALDQVGEQRLKEFQLQDLSKALCDAFSRLLGRPVYQVFGDIQSALINAVFQSKVAPNSRNLVHNMSTPLLGQFLVVINGYILVRNERGLTDYLALEPPFGEHYLRMIDELQRVYPATATGSAALLEQKCSQALGAAREGADGSPWTAFVKFMTQYLAYLRDVTSDVGKYLETYELLSELQRRVNSALGHAVLGYLVLPVVITNAKLVCRLAIGLDKQPELIAHLRSSHPGGGGEDGGPRETLPERAANILRSAFVTCLNDRSASSLDENGQPTGKRRGIYTIANLCLKILFQCRKTRNATQIFENIYNHSPPLAAYPKRERVTYLYYLGRFYFQNSHFYRAQLALQHAYDLCPAHASCVRQRRLILVYLVPSNIILGRFPSASLLSRPEAQGFDARFQTLCLAIRQGNLAVFHQHLAFDGPHASWLLHFRILLQLRNRCEPLVWRSLVRKTWLLHGTRPVEGSKVAPQVDVRDLVALFAYLSSDDDYDPDQSQKKYIDPDFAGLAPPALNPPSSSFPTQQDDDDIAGTWAVESKLSSLLDQGLLVGFLSHAKLKYAITGATRKGGDALAAGFPTPWQVLSAKAGGSEEVPGWKREVVDAGDGEVRPGPGVVMRFGSMRAVGAVG